jgi:hypothetical protein
MKKEKNRNFDSSNTKAKDTSSWIDGIFLDPRDFEDDEDDDSLLESSYE